MLSMQAGKLLLWILVTLAAVLLAGVMFSEHCQLHLALAHTLRCTVYDCVG